MVAIAGIAGLGPLRPTRHDRTAEPTRPSSAGTSLGGVGIEEALDRLIASSLALVPGADCAKVSVIDDGRLCAIVASSQLTASLDGAQHVARHGPCLEAISARAAVRCDDLGTDARWPGFAAHAATAGLHSVLSYPIDIPSDAGAALSLFSFRVGAFEAQSEAIGAMLADHAALALLNERQERQFRTALASRDVIGQAKGMIMERFGVDASRAFAMLTQISQETNTPVRELAASLVGRTRK